MIDLGTVRPGSTIRIPFNTFDKDDGSAITMTNFAAADILVYKDGNTTARASTSGFTATTDFNSKTGKQLAIIDLADNTTADFYAAGSEYLVAIDQVTVDSVTVGGWVARFRIGYPDAILDTTIATLSSQTSFTLTVGPAEDNALVGRQVVIHDAASAVQLAYGVISAYTGSTKTVTLIAAPTFTIAAKDNISVLMAMPLQPTTFGRSLDVSSGGEAGVDWANVGTPGSTVNLSATTVNLTNTATTLTNDPTGVGTLLTRLGTPSDLGGGATVAANLADIESQTDDIGVAGAGLTEAGGTGDQFTAIPWNASWDAEVQSEVDDALVARNLDHLVHLAVDTDFATTVHVDSVLGQMVQTADGGFARATDSLEAVRDRGDSAWTTATGFSTHSAADVWAVGTRTLTSISGLGIALATKLTKYVQLLARKDSAIATDNATELTEINADGGSGAGAYANSTDAQEAIRDRGDAAWITATGFSTLDASGVRTAIGLASANLDTQLAAIAADLPQRITKNTALAAFPFLMVDATDLSTPETGLTITATRSLDGAAFGACANAVSETGNGWYKIDLAAGDLNGNTVALRFTASGAATRNITLITQPT